MRPPRASLQSTTLLCGRGSRYWVQTEGLPLSLKTIRHGRARYTVGRNEFAIDDRGWLIVNEDQPYTIEIASPCEVETFIVWFPRGWAEEVWRSVTTGSAALLAEPEAPRARNDRVSFFETYTENDPRVTPVVTVLHRAIATGEAADDAWLEQTLRALLVRLLGSQHDLAGKIARLPAVRAATREELWRRLSRARDFVHACCEQPLTLSQMAAVAALSPHHFLRTFRAAFHQTPHDWLASCRIDRAKTLLTRTELPITEICFAVGYEAPGAFSTRFQRHAGRSPREWRSAGRRPAA